MRLSRGFLRNHPKLCQGGLDYVLYRRLHLLASAILRTDRRGRHREHAPGSMLIGPCVLGGKLGPVMSKGAAALVLVKSSWLDVEARGSACAHVINVVHSSAGITLSMVGA